MVKQCIVDLAAWLVMVLENPFVRKKGIWICGWIYYNGVEELKILKTFLELFDDGSIVLIFFLFNIFKKNKSIFLFLVVVGGIFQRVWLNS